MEKVENPCKNCITLAMCREKGKVKGGVAKLSYTCPMLDNYLRQGEEYWDIIYVYDAYSFFSRGIE